MCQHACSLSARAWSRSTPYGSVGSATSVKQTGPGQMASGNAQFAGSPGAPFLTHELNEVGMSSVGWPLTSAATMFVGYETWNAESRLAVHRVDVDLLAAAEREAGERRAVDIEADG